MQFSNLQINNLQIFKSPNLQINNLQINNFKSPLFLFGFNLNKRTFVQFIRSSK